jgi:hypothetical protein
MSSNLDLINDALSLIGVLPEGVVATPEQGELALRQGNELADEWAEDEISVNWAPQSALQDACSLSGVELTAFKYHLAIRLCPHFGREPGPTLGFLADSSFKRLQRIQMVRAQEPVTLSLPAAEGAYGTENILTGE